MDKNKTQNDAIETTTPAFGKKLTIRDLEQVSGGRAATKYKISDGGYTEEGEA